MAIAKPNFGTGFAGFFVFMLATLITQVCRIEQATAGPQQSEFNYAGYQPVDLDELISRQKPVNGADLFPGLPLKIVGKLESYGQSCSTGFLKKTMIMGGMWREGVPITRCIKVRTAKNRVVPLFIQDSVAEFLPKEIPLGCPVTFFVVHMFTSSEKIGLLVNEFSDGKAEIK